MPERFSNCDSVFKRTEQEKLTCRRFVHSTQLSRCRRRVCFTLPPWFVVAA
jgi:hypothetical protein